MKPHPRNVPGEFYLANGCCTLCGIPWHFAPELFAYDDSGCWVARQPASTDERRKMLKVLDAQELGCIRSRSV
jgi:4Fe-4S single cluster domain of Ferredoxin I